MTAVVHPTLALSRVRRAFGRAAATYDAHAVLERAVGDELVERVAALDLKPRRMLDLGTGTGYVARSLRAVHRRAPVVGVDAALPMLAAARARQGFLSRQPLVCADALRLPFADGGFDLACANLLLPWIGNHTALFTEVRRVLAPGGAFVFSTLGPDTLRELRAAYATLDDAPHVNGFLDMHDLGDALARAGYDDPVLDVDRYALTYQALDDLYADLRATGSTVVAGAAAGLAGRGRRARVAAAYEAHRRDGRLPASVEVIHGRALAGSGPRPVPNVGGEVAVPVSALRRRR